MQTTIPILSRGAFRAIACLGLSALSTTAGAQAAPFQALHQFDTDVFDCVTCDMPPILGKDGVLYGVTDAGGGNNWGMLYRIGSDGTFRVLHSFGGKSKALAPAGQPVQMPNGDLWGVTANTSAKKGVLGTVWRYTASGKFSITDNFLGSNGAHPTSLVAGPDGRLYGIASDGGAYGKGELFAVDAAGLIQPIYSFSSKTVAINPYMQLTVARDGTFYGVAISWIQSQTGHVAWRYGTDGSFSVLHQFGGDYFAGGLVEGPDGALYGQTWLGDPQTNCCGTVYRLAKDGSSVTVLHTFDGSDGVAPNGLLNVDASGQLVGVAQDGGLNHVGSVFKLGIDGSGFTTLYNFDAAGGYPTGINLAADGKGYGVSESGGTWNFGNVWKLALTDF